ncbi:MAG TPA: hypothetical protein VMS17_26990 [Gemmataceae bacterium]|nr:hypothetical protein [Gemmataceae bacterium]
MKLRYVVFRYQPDLSKDDWLPLGVVAECPSDDEPEIGVMCLESAEARGGSELAGAMLQNVPAILNEEVEKTRARLLPGEDFLEVLRAQNPWNFHFTVAQEQTVKAEDLQQATMDLFYRHVLRRPSPSEAEPKRKPQKAIRPRRMESYVVAV